jgi:hypothetical protein
MTDIKKIKAPMANLQNKYNLAIIIPLAIKGLILDSLKNLVDHP